ncbi:hypothetical protein HZA43_03090 [Candidatus Peregrinibacteria bacterium]|nr:hypothetical protein [Candidatus Peregrinibacteria bacterium]
MPYHLSIPCKFGIESVLADELKNLGFNNLNVLNGGVEFYGNAETIVKTNLWLRTGERVLIKLAEFPAVTFDELFEGVRKIQWTDYIQKKRPDQYLKQVRLIAIALTPKLPIHCQKSDCGMPQKTIP